jgi:alanyl-tRNA synthetase
MMGFDMTVRDVRSAFLSFFKSKGHAVLPGASLLPKDDPSILFTVAGMIPFKRVFLGQKKLAHDCVTTAQPCLRAGGKHNDLREVGPSPRHHTFFEMLGNFSFGAYFKAEAIALAWAFLTEELKLPKERLWITVYQDDDETEAIWREKIGIDPKRMSRCGDDDNFWAMGDTGPCGPCTEIFYDYGPDVPGAPPGHEAKPGEPDHRYVEIWNLVFMQYDRDASGKLNPLPKPSVDTGMGLERITAVLEGVQDNYQSSLFQPLLRALADYVKPVVLHDIVARIVVDHLRATAFLMADGVMPSNEGAGYVLRRIMRRAMRYAYQQDYRGLLFSPVLPVLVKQMGAAYPHLKAQAAQIKRAMDAEEKQFATTIEQGMQWVDKAIEAAKASSVSVLSADVLFQLYDTYGFPVDLVEDIASEAGLGIDLEGFELAMQGQKARSRAHQTFKGVVNSGLSDCAVATEFLGYKLLRSDACIVGLSVSGVRQKQLQGSEDAIVLLDKTPFYPEGGGQVGDQGVIQTTQGIFEVYDTQKEGERILHFGRLRSGVLSEGDVVDALVSSDRALIAANHSATHLLHAVLRGYFGEHVVQKGSLVARDRLRFDFTHTAPCSVDDIRVIESKVNALVRENLASDVQEMSPDAAKDAGAMALFGEQYGETVRVLSFGAASKELCGGTHVAALGAIGLFKIIQETGVSSGVRRIEALTGQKALDWVHAQSDQLNAVAAALKTQVDRVVPRLKQCLTDHRALEKAHVALKKDARSGKGNDSLLAKVMWGSVGFMASSYQADSHAVLREQADMLRGRLGDDLLLLSAEHGGKVLLLLVVGSGLKGRIAAKDALNVLVSVMGGSGGGRPDLAQGVGLDAKRLPEAIDALKAWVLFQS